ncbi:MAG TPA: hypothetical protein VK446_10005 [Methylocystis sp.]|nr:hypothetical protein [Methylocystis sp.]
MKSYALIAAAALFVGMTGAAYAECDTHKGDRDADKQTRCSEKCEDYWTSRKQNYFSDIEKLKGEAVTCFEQCGCKEHGEKFLSR